MCGRYAASFTPGDLVDAFEVEQDYTTQHSRSLLVRPQDPPAGRPDWNVAPTKAAPVVLSRRPKGEMGPPVRQLRLLTWGLVPSWSRDTKAGVRMINARAETLLDKRAYAKAATSRRCLVPADGWYEWQASPVALGAKGKPRKQPFFIRRADGMPAAFAGIYEFWRDRGLPDGDPDAWLVTYAIVTQAAEPGLDRIHDRQPLVLDRDAWSRWLDPEETSPDAVAQMIAGADAGRFEAWPVSAAVSGGRANGPSLLEPAPADELIGVVDPATGEVIGGADL